MFLISLKTLKGKFFLLLSAVVAAVIVFSLLSSSENREYSPADGAPDFSAANYEEILYFISALGYTVKSSPESVSEVIIPAEFNDVYKNYNELQKQAGLDLSLYKGKAVKKWTYTLTNYPQYESSDAIRINLLVYNGRIIGGDICNIEIDGFMHSLR